MKALPLLDLAMLWMARLLALWMVSNCVLMIFPGLIGRKSFDPMTLKIYDTGIALLFVLGAWNLQSGIARWCLGLGGAALVYTQVLMPLMMPDEIRFAPGNWSGMIFAVVGLTSILWVSLHPPQRFRYSV